MNHISLNTSMRSNLLSLQQTSKLQDKTSMRLATGLKVSTAIDNPSSYYTAQSLNSRAEDLDALLNSMGQGIQTIKAATEALESGSKFLEQASAIAMQAITESTAEPTNAIVRLAATRSTADFVADGYTEITAGMTTDEIQALIVDDAKLVLGANVTLDKGLNINAKNVTIEGNGNKLNYATAAAENMVNVTGSGAKIHNLELVYNNTNSAGGSAIAIDGATASADISVIKLTGNGSKVYGIRALNKASVTLDNTLGISVSGTGSQKLVNGNGELFSGKSNTDAIVNQIGADGLAATAATQFYVGSKTGDFGQGSWYLPSIGELMQVYGYNESAMTSGGGSSGMTGANKTVINDALATLAGKDSSVASTLTNGYYWSSSEYNNNYSWGLNMSDGYRASNYKDSYNYVRCFQLVENCFDPSTLSAGGSGGGSSGGSAAAPKIGDIMYDDKTYGSAADYDGSKTAVGVITNVSGSDATIMNLKDLTFSSSGAVGNFNPDNPYGGSQNYSYHTTNAKYSTDITGINNYNSTDLLNAMKTGGSISVTNTYTPAPGPSPDPGPNPAPGGKVNAADFAAQFNSILNQYDSLVSDASYKGVNLLQSDNLLLNFNETRSSKLEVNGNDASTKGLGLNQADWKTLSDINQSVQELTAAINSIRSMSSELGNYYSIVTNREEFTNNLINVLTEGADKLTLADMNEESANMLALQTQQQLAVNSLSLASQASQGVLKLF